MYYKISLMKGLFRRYYSYAFEKFIGSQCLSKIVNGRIEHLRALWLKTTIEHINIQIGLIK